MTDSPREEPRPDRLPEIRAQWSGRTDSEHPMIRKMQDHVAWLVAEVEKLREELTERDRLADEVLRQIRQGGPTDD